jgi:hypothetical protein
MRIKTSARKYIAISTYIFLAIGLAGCASSVQTAQQPQDNFGVTPACSPSEIDNGSAWIEGQLKAFDNEDPEAAYQFASESFRVRSNLQQFVAIIVTNYGFLLDINSYSVGTCSKSADAYLFDVQVIDTAGEKYSMEYTLSLVNGRWGVDAASVTVSDDQPLTT